MARPQIEIELEKMAKNSCASAFVHIAKDKNVLSPEMLPTFILLLLE